ncbi:MAG TPA: hypothetical protein VLZ72_02900, partial [Flavobacterium sp.]|nr:hypothetical protein [Flavobacterium sp.]
MDSTLVLILLLSPIIGFLFNLFFGKNLSKSLSGTIGTIAVGISFVVSIILFNKVLQSGEGITVHFFDWIQVSNFDIGFSFLLDQLSLLWLLFVTGIGTLIHVYSISYMHDDENLNKFFS